MLALPIALLSLFLGSAQGATPEKEFAVSARYAVGGEGGWDYVTVYPSAEGSVEDRWCRARSRSLL